MKNLILLFALFTFFSCGNDRSEEDIREVRLNETKQITQNTTLKSADTTAALSIPSIHCEGCEMTIKDAVKELDGVKSIEIDTAKVAVIQYDPELSDINTIKKKITDAGYESFELEE
jgi:copper chaperone CopZ